MAILYKFKKITLCIFVYHTDVKANYTGVNDLYVQALGKIPHHVQ